MIRIVLLLAVVGNAAFGLLPDEKNNVEVYRKAKESVVNITSVTLKRDFFFDMIPQQGVGSGVLIRKEGFILTNDHVVGKATKLEVTLHDKSTFPAKLVGTDPDTDLAVIQIQARGRTSFPFLPLKGDLSLDVGQKVLAIGNPFGLGGSLSVGIISSLERDIRTQTGRMLKNIIQTDAAINPGNSGGPLLNSDGQLIGINTQIVSSSGGSDGVGFAISAKTAAMIAGQLIRVGKVLRPSLGLYGVGLSRGLLKALNYPLDYGVMITEVGRRSAARKGGLKAADREIVAGFRRIPYGGDVIFRLDDTPVATMSEIQDIIFEKKSGESVVIHYYRGTKRRKVSISLTVPKRGGKSM